MERDWLTFVQVLCVYRQIFYLVSTDEIIGVRNYAKPLIGH